MGEEERERGGGMYDDKDGIDQDQHQMILSWSVVSCCELLSLGWRVGGKSSLMELAQGISRLESYNHNHSKYHNKVFCFHSHL